jgi:hypothetical protein
LVSGVIDVTSGEEVEEVGDGFDAAADGDAKLAVGEEVGGKVGAEVGHDDGSGEAAPSRSNTNGAEFEGVGRIFM